MTQTRQIVIGTPVVEQVSFGLVDSKYRVIGAQIVRANVEFAPILEGASSFYTIPEGNYFRAQVSCTRNGVPFGACQPRKLFTTEAEMESWIAERVNNSKKTYTKKLAA